MNILSDDYKIQYKGNDFLIGGTGLSPDYAFPIVNATAPIPNPKNQAVVYINKSAFKSLGINDIDIVSYLSYGSNSLSAPQIVHQSQAIMKDLVGEISFNVYTNENAKPMGII